MMIKKVELAHISEEVAVHLIRERSESLSLMKMVPKMSNTIIIIIW